MEVLFKSKDSQAMLVKRSARFDEKGELLGVFMVPDRFDNQGDTASEEVTRTTAHDAMQEGIEIDLHHDGNPVSKEQAWLAESFIIDGGDTRFQNWKDNEGNPVDVTGAWGGVIRIEDENIRQAFREGKLRGVSMFGPAAVETISKSSEKKDEPMTDEEIQKLAEALKPKEPAKEPVKEPEKKSSDKPKSKVKLTADPEKLREMAQQRKIDKILDGLDPDDDEALLKAAQEIEDIRNPPKKDPVPEKESQEEDKKPASNAGIPPAKKSEEEESKEDFDAMVKEMTEAATY